MNEKLLQYLWNFKIFTNFDFRDVDGNHLEILDFGKWNYDSGPDFLFAKIKINDIVLAGNIELHVKSSDWIFHRHTGNPEFDNLILHAVFIHDVEIEELENKNVPTLELKDYIDETLLWKYESLLKENRFIPCENIFDPDKIPFQFCEETLLKKLDEKSLEIEASLKRNRNNYEAVLFQHLAYAFGLKVNAPVFKQMAECLDFTVVNKIRHNLTQLEALFYGTSGWLEKPRDDEMKIWKREFDFLSTKYQLHTNRFFPKFSKLRPPNFPTVRLAQLASLYHLHQHLFSKMVMAKRVGDLYELLKDVKASAYWNTRYNFGKTSDVSGEKGLTPEFMDLLILNAVLPVKYAWRKHRDEYIIEDIFAVYRGIAAEKNSITEGWKSLKAPMESALESQAYNYQHRMFCETKNCLNCSIGFQLMKRP